MLDRIASIIAAETASGHVLGDGQWRAAAQMPASQLSAPGGDLHRLWEMCLRYRAALHEISQRVGERNLTRLARHALGDGAAAAAAGQAATVEELGWAVRTVRVQWAAAQPDAKPSWLVGWDELDTGQRQVDMLIGVAVYMRGAGPPASGSSPASTRPPVGRPCRPTGRRCSTRSMWCVRRQPRLPGVRRGGTAV